MHFKRRPLMRKDSVLRAVRVACQERSQKGGLSADPIKPVITWNVRAYSVTHNTK